MTEKTHNFLASATEPELYRRIGFDEKLEFEALSCLTRGDDRGAMQRFGRLARLLDWSPGSRLDRSIVHLFMDLCHCVNRRLFPPSIQPEEYRLHRTSIIEAFGAIDDPDQARERFLRELRRLIRERRRGKPARNPLVRRAIDLVRERYQERLMLTQVAEALNVSPNYLSRVFRRETGTTLTAFVQEVRMDHARRLLEQGGHSLSEIAYRVGYQNYRDFYRNFVKREKASPREVLKRMARRE